MIDSKGQSIRAALICFGGQIMARKSRYMGYVEGLEQLKAKHEKRRKIEKEKSLTRKLNQYKKEVRENG